MLLSASTSLFGGALLASAALASPAHPPIRQTTNQEGTPNVAAPSDWKSAVKNVVILVLENRSFDSVFGDVSYHDDVNSLVGKQYCNPINITTGNLGSICATNTLPDISPEDPDHGISGVNMQIFGTWHPEESSVQSGSQKAVMDGFVTQQLNRYHTDNISIGVRPIDYLSAQQVPILTSLAQEYVLFDRWFADVPGPTNPNRAYLTSGTSHGHGRNDVLFNWGGLPQVSIFQALSEKNISWINYSNTTNASAAYIAPDDKTSGGFNPDALFYNWTVATKAYETNIKPLSQFYDNAKDGKLPQMSYLNPECCSYDSFHPPSPVSMGEAFVKKVYDALRSSPQWNETLLILTFDEHGGFADHVPPPSNVPAGDKLTYTEKALDGANITFAFDRMGIRVPTILISPWVGKGIVEHQRAGQSGEYSASSIIATLSMLWDLPNFSPRTAWSSTFEHLFLGEPRSDAIQHLPKSAQQ
ncbi:hypothetical protein QFC21_002729 [Naganishia friedmannii]|uniref:Uncharacterized protein n=1 Tax=Naganishia friedmannii TaxID=89922 RepID=A0ACC2VTK5_9TREE|nr:hypothetical protein QFC21_002729 [Naganishia friedmannii]